MSIKTLIRVLIITGLLYCCKSNEDKKTSVIRINPQNAKREIYLSEIADSVKYIRLQTDSNCVMGRLHSIYIKDKYIYALDVSQHIVFIFDKNGKYISKLDKRGKGPDEYLYLGPTFIDENEEFIETIGICGQDRFLLKYSNISFDLLSKQPMPNIKANSCRKNGRTIYYSTQQNDNLVDNQLTNADIIIARDGTIVKKLFDKNIVTNNMGYTPNSESFTLNDKGKIFVSIMFDNSFYLLENLTAKPIISVDFGKFSIDNSMGLKTTTEQLEYLEQVDGLASFPVLNINNANILAFSYYYMQHSDTRGFKLSNLRQYIHMKESNRIFHTEKILNDISTFPREIYISSCYSGINHEVWYNEYLVDIVQPGQYFSESETSMVVDGIGEITLNDNPIIVLMKMKTGI